jgi:hypothetical protein
MDAHLALIVKDLLSIMESAMPVQLYNLQQVLPQVMDVNAAIVACSGLQAIVLVLAIFLQKDFLQLYQILQ